MSKIPDFIINQLGGDEHDAVLAMDKTIDGLLAYIMLSRRISYSQDTEEMVEYRRLHEWVDGLIEKETR